MAKRYYYECVRQCDIGWRGPDPRRERWSTRGGMLVQPPDVMHSKRLYPSVASAGRAGLSVGLNDVRPEADIIVTDKPVAKNYTQTVTKKVSRPRFDPTTGRRHGRYFRRKTNPPKLRILEPDEIDNDVRRNAIDLPWDVSLFTDATGDVILPQDVAIKDSAPRVSTGYEGEDPDAVGAEGVTNE